MNTCTNFRTRYRGSEATPKMEFSVTLVDG